MKEGRLNYKDYPDAVKGLFDLETYIKESELERSLVHLIKIRSSQLNGCAHCLDMHVKEARVDGETEQRIYGLEVWRRTPYYTDRERAALKWTEALTLISKNEVSDDLFEEVSQVFSSKELLEVTMVIISINDFNRLVKPFRVVKGDYRPKRKLKP